jgi:hypothetical protein
MAPPGIILSPDGINTFVLGAAMDSFFKRKAGPQVHPWDLVVADVFQPIGIVHLPTMHTIEPRRGMQASRVLHQRSLIRPGERRVRWGYGCVLNCVQHGSDRHRETLEQRRGRLCPARKHTMLDIRGPCQA